MLLYQGIITLDYNPGTDVLVTSMPDVKQFTLSEVSFCLRLIVDHLRHYDIKHLLLDSSKSVVDNEDEAYKALASQFALDLNRTRLKKVARVGTTNGKREEQSAKLSQELKQELNLTLEFKTFQETTEAMDWLLASVQPA